MFLSDCFNHNHNKCPRDESLFSAVKYSMKWILWVWTCQTPFECCENNIDLLRNGQYRLNSISLNFIWHLNDVCPDLKVIDNTHTHTYLIWPDSICTDCIENEHFIRIKVRDSQGIRVKMVCFGRCAKRPRINTGFSFESDVSLSSLGDSVAIAT